MIADNKFWMVIIICTVISILCRLLPLTINVNALPFKLQKIIERLARYISVVLLTTLLVGVVHKQADSGEHYSWMLPVMIAWLLSATTRLKPWQVFLMVSACWGVIHILF